MTDKEFITMRRTESQRSVRPRRPAASAVARIGHPAAVWAVAAAIALLGALLVSCGGKSDTPVGAPHSATAAGAQAGGTRLGDCEYANALVRSLERFTTAVPPFGTAGVEGKDGVIRSLDTFDGELAALIGELRGYQLNADIARVNDGVVQVFEDTRRQLPELKSAVESGDVARLTTAATTLTVEVFPRLDTVQAENKAAFDRLNRCARAHDQFNVATAYA